MNRNTRLTTSGMLTMALLSHFCLVVLSTPANGQDAEQKGMRDMRTVIENLEKSFADNPQTRVPTGELPENLAARMDGDHDGYVTKEEFEKVREAMRSGRNRGPRDRSDFTFLRDEGFPLNVNPEIVSAQDAELGDGDMVMGVIVNGEPRAYPVNYMNGPQNEVVNDVLGGQAIASTW